MMFLHRALFPFITISLPSICSAKPTDIFSLKKIAFEPLCAQACRVAIAESPLECTPNVPHVTSAQCYASNEPFLTTLALCIKIHCNKLSKSQVDDFWRRNAVGWASVQPPPKLSYEQALSSDTTEVTIRRGNPINSSSLINEYEYSQVVRLLSQWNQSESNHAIYALALLCSGILVPIILTMLEYICPKYLNAKFHAILVYPSAWQRGWYVSIRDTGDINPTRGQGLYVLFMVGLNIGLTIPGLMSQKTDSWDWDNRDGKFISSLANRFGALSLANMPLIFLYCGRNNFLLWTTNWSHSTFLVLHRWIGYVSILQAILHSILFLHLANQEGKLSTWDKAPAWYTGAIATLAISIIGPLSIAQIRRKAYEFFLTVHIYISIAFIAALFYHLYYLFDTRTMGYCLYIWAVVVFWGFDRLARIVRLMKNGIHHATITPLDGDYIRVDIPRAMVNGHAYLYFPTLTWRFWENHPFSAVSPMSRADDGLLCKIQKGSASGIVDSQFSAVEQRHSSISQISKPLSPFSPRSIYIPGMTPSPPISPKSVSTFMSAKTLLRGPMSPTDSISELLTPTTLVGSVSQHGAESGVTFYMRTHAGTTGLLRTRSRLPVLVEASYGIPTNLTPYPLLICIAGGVGITAILPYLQAHSAANGLGSTKLFWGSRSRALVQALHDDVDRFDGETAVGRRLEVADILHREIAAAGERRDVAVVVSGPKAMADEVRSMVCEIGRKRKGATRLVDECFGW